MCDSGVVEAPGSLDMMIYRLLRRLNGLQGAVGYRCGTNTIAFLFSISDDCMPVGPEADGRGVDGVANDGKAASDRLRRPTRNRRHNVFLCNRAETVLVIAHSISPRSAGRAGST
jgi:hypothetical protein